jgi:hypothetical protein
MSDWQISPHLSESQPHRVRSFKELAVSFKSSNRLRWYEVLYYKGVDFNFVASRSTTSFIVWSNDIKLKATIEVSSLLPLSVNKLSTEIQQIVDTMLIRQIHDI